MYKVALIWSHRLRHKHEQTRSTVYTPTKLHSKYNNNNNIWVPVGKEL